MVEMTTRNSHLVVARVVDTEERSDWWQSNKPSKWDDTAKARIDRK